MRHGVPGRGCSPSASTRRPVPTISARFMPTTANGWFAAAKSSCVAPTALAGSHNVANALAALALCEAAGLPGHR